MTISRTMTLARVVWLEMLRRKDFYVLLILLGVLLFYLMSLNVFGLSGAVSHVKDIGLVLTWLFSWILAITTAGRQLPQEERSGTIYPLLAKPITRGDLIAGKWLGSWLGVVGATAVFYAGVYTVVLLRGGSFDLPALAQAFVLHGALLAILTALALLLATRLNFDAAVTMSFVIAFSALVIVPKVPHILTQESGMTAHALSALYYGLPHLELFDMRVRVVHDWGTASWSTFASILVYGAVWVTLLLALAWRSYRDKRFQRGGA